jgi:hypothetical protein
MSNDSRTDRALADWLGKIFREVDWLIPPYVTTGFLSTLARVIEVAPPSERLQIMSLTFAEVYSPEYLAGMFLERYSKIVHVRDFERHIDESIRSYFSGNKLAAVTTWMPAIEGIVRKIATSHSRDVARGTSRLNVEFRAFVDEERNSTHCYGARLAMLELLRDFLENRLLKDTRDYVGLNEFNRHGILHSIYHKFGEDINFFRTITLLDLLCYSIGLTEGISSFAPAPTSESLKLAAHFTWLQSLSKYRLSERTAAKCS